MRERTKEFTRQLQRFWKPIVAVAGFAIVSVIAISIAFAYTSSITMVRSGTTDVVSGSVYTWEDGKQEQWAAIVTTDDPNLKGNDSAIRAATVFQSSNPSAVQAYKVADGVYNIKANGAGQSEIKAIFTDGNNVQTTTTAVIKVPLKLTTQLDGPNNDVLILSNNVQSIYTNVASGADLEFTSEPSGLVSAEYKENGRIEITSLSSGAGQLRIRDRTTGLDINIKILSCVTLKVAGTLPVEADPGVETDAFTNATNALGASYVGFTSSNEDIFIANETGKITGLKAGDAELMIYPKVDDYTVYGFSTFEEFVSKCGAKRKIRIKFGILNGKQLTGVVGDSIRLQTNSSDAGTITWITNNNKVAIVDGTSGEVSLVGSGEAIITAILTTSSGTQQASVAVTVGDNFYLDKIEVTLNVGKTVDLKGIITATMGEVQWYIADEKFYGTNLPSDSEKVNGMYNNTKVASIVKSDVNQITITALERGKCYVTAYVEYNGVKKFAYCEVNVTTPVTDVTMTPTKLHLTSGDPERNSAPLMLLFNTEGGQENPDNRNIEWISSNENIATVRKLGDGTAMVEAVDGTKGGNVVISAVTIDGIKIATCDVYVRVPVDGIKLSENVVKVQFKVGIYQLAYKITPEGEGVDQDVMWSSSDEEVLTVDENGLVTFHKPGNATVTVQTHDVGFDGFNKKDTCNFTVIEPVTDLTLDTTDATLKIGEQLRITALILPEEATNKKLYWTSSNTNVAKVDEYGLVTAVGSGSATILCQSEDSGITAMCNITVYQPVESVKLSYNEMTVRKNTVFWLHADVQPVDAHNKDLIWTSSDVNVCTVDSYGMITAVNPGECVITARSADTGVFDTCSIIVTEPVTGITLNVNDLFLYTGEKALLIPTVTPIDADNKAVTYFSSDPEVATVDENGVVTAIKGGEIIITVTTVERGLVASCKVTVYEFVSSISINEKDKPYINIGTTKRLTATIKPDSATNKSLTWTSSDPSIISINDKGIVTANKVGTVLITVMTNDGSGLTDQMSLTSIYPVTSITVNPAYVTVIEGQSKFVTATVNPGNATIKDVNWSSSDPTTATVDHNGEITGVKAGICYVYATSTDGNDIVGTVKVTVKKAVPATSVIINAKELTMFPGQSRDLNVRTRPTNSTDNTTWVSSDTSVATVDANGKVVAKGQGNCVIYCIADSGVESECQVNVLAINASSITIEQYDSYQLDVYGCTEKIVWYTNNNRVATVDANGKVIGRSVGTTTIVAKVNGELLYCRVTVTKIKK